MTGISGSLSLTSVSGDASVTGIDLAFEASTTSGDMAVTAQSLRKTHVRTVSGDLSIGGALDPKGSHSAETISGDIELLPSNGVSISMTSVSGSIHAPGLGRPDQSRGRGSLVVGNGEARLTFRTMSGDLTVRRADPFASSPTAAADARAAAAPSLPRVPGIPELPATPAPPAPPQPPPAPRVSVPSDDSPTTVWPTPVSEPLPDPGAALTTELDVLRALERGEIDVSTASRLLAEKSNA
jgi:hypothetical protein